MVCEAATRGHPAVTVSLISFSPAPSVSLLQRCSANTWHCTKFSVWSQGDVSHCIILRRHGQLGLARLQGDSAALGLLHSLLSAGVYLPDSLSKSSCHHETHGNSVDQLSSCKCKAAFLLQCNDTGFVWKQGERLSKWFYIQQSALGLILPITK